MIDLDLQKKLIDAKCKVAFNAMGSSLSAFKSGGRVATVVTVRGERELVDCIKLLNNSRAEYKIVGNCSNILISDEGYDGVIVRTALSNKIHNDNGVIYAEAGVKLSHLARWSANESLSGLEWAEGIPACIGGAIFQNAGCYGHDMSEVVAKVRLFDGEKIFDLAKENMDFGYRHSILSVIPHICLGAYFCLERGGYYEIAGRADEYRLKRQYSQPKAPSLGSVFKRVGDKSAALYIDKLGLKGCSVGGAYISSEHSGFICNNGFGTSDDFLHLARFAQKEVYDKEGIFFPLEVEYLGKKNDIYKRLIGEIS